MKKLLAFLLIALSVLPLLVACASDPVTPPVTTESDEPAPTALTLTEEYVIVRSDIDTTTQGKAQMDAAVELKKRLRDEFGLDLRIVTDFVSEYENNRQAKEIIVGQVKGFGEEYTFDMTSIGNAGMSITTKGEKIILGAISKTGLNYAVEALIANLTKTEEGAVFAPSSPIILTSAQIMGDAMNFNKTRRMDITDRSGLVSICYSMWFNHIYGNGADYVNEDASHMLYNITDILAGKASWGHPTGFHYWAKPAQGYYRSTNKTATENNLKLLGEAGVDFLILDYTFSSMAAWGPQTDQWDKTFLSPATVLLDAVAERVKQGLPTPRVVFWVGNRDMFGAMKQYFYSQEKWEDCFVYWNDKPFILEWTFSGNDSDFFTVRGMNGLRGNQEEGQWSYLNIDNSQNKALSPEGGIEIEQMPVCVAVQETYMSEESAHGRDHGIFWYGHWKNAFETMPKIITLTWWNEWCAQRLPVGAPFDEYEFTDAYNAEYSRDIEPMEGGHGDQYYRWMIQYIAAYRSGEDCPVLVEEGYEDKVK